MDGWNSKSDPGMLPGSVGAPETLGLAEIKSRIHRKLLSRLNLANLEAVSREEATQAIRTTIQEIMAADREHVALNLKERERLSVEILDEIFGLGPLEPLMKDPEVSDILVNTFNDVWIEKHGKLYQTTRPPWWMPGSRTTPESTPSSRPWRWTARTSPSGASRRTCCRTRTS
jgi:pilus assembly protein CpaF